jgi:hypothetical protein
VLHPPVESAVVSGSPWRAVLCSQTAGTSYDQSTGKRIASQRATEPVAGTGRVGFPGNMGPLPTKYQTGGGDVPRWGLKPESPCSSGKGKLGTHNRKDLNQRAEARLQEASSLIWDLFQEPKQRIYKSRLQLLSGDARYSGHIAEPLYGRSGSPRALAASPTSVLLDAELVPRGSPAGALALPVG